VRSREGVIGTLHFRVDRISLVFLVLLLSVIGAHAADEEINPEYVDPDDKATVDELSFAAQNPVANLISLPFQNNLQILENGKIFNNLLIQPVLPFALTKDWLLVTRTIIPVLTLEDPPPGFDGTGLGDIQQSFFLSPRKPTRFGLIWGFGPILTYPSATEDIFGSGKWGAGPSFVGLMIKGPWVFGTLANNTWSFAGDSDRRDVNRFVLQPFVNYNFPGGWFLQSSPLITADWEAPSGQKWTVPVGAGVGRTFAIGRQPMTVILTNFYNAVRPTGGPEWNIRLQIQFLFPQ
jgi:hypothetical protein